MIFWKLKKKHKKWYVINQIFIIVCLAAALITAWKINKITLPTEGSKMIAGVGFISTIGIFVAAVLSRIGNLFKVKSVGFIVMWFMFLGLQYILQPMIWAIGLMLIPLLIDDMIFQSIWKNIWYNQYHDHVKVIQ